MCGIGYRSGVLTSFKRRKSPQGRQLPSDLGTMCKGDDHWLSERRITTFETLISKLVSGDPKLVRRKAPCSTMKRRTASWDKMLHSMLNCGNLKSGPHEWRKFCQKFALCVDCGKDRVKVKNTCGSEAAVDWGEIRCVDLLPAGQIRH